VRYNAVQAAIEKERLAKQEQKLKEKAKEPGNNMSKLNKTIIDFCVTIFTHYFI